MTAINPAGSASIRGTNDASTTQNRDGLTNLSMDDFMKLLITEMQNQDPLEPMSNAEMLQQIGQIRGIGATDQLTRTLTSLSNSQELVTASNLIGREVQALADEGTEVNGVVDRVTVETDEANQRMIKVHVEGKTIDMRNIRQINSV